MIRVIPVTVCFLICSILISGCVSSPRFTSVRYPETRTVNGAMVEEGIASYYADEFNGRKTSSGEIFDMNALTAAHQTLPFNTRVRVTNLENGKSVIVRINDRGPFKDQRIIDLSLEAARSIGMVGPGTARVRIEIISPEEKE